MNIPNFDSFSFFPLISMNRDPNEYVICAKSKTNRSKTFKTTKIEMKENKKKM